MFAKTASFPECEGCKGDRCESVKCDEALFPVLDRKLDALFEWKKWMCSRTTYSYPEGTCTLNGVVIFQRNVWHNCKGCRYY